MVKVGHIYSLSLSMKSSPTSGRLEKSFLWVRCNQPPMAELDVVDWEGLIAKVKGPCGGCPRNATKTPLLFNRKVSLGNVEFIVVSQEPGFWMNSSQDGKEEILGQLCRKGNKDIPDCKKANPLSKVLEIFDNFDPCNSKVYWTHALKCIPNKSDRDINKEWRRGCDQMQRGFSR